MLKTLLSRLGQGVVVIFFLISITFVLVRLMPGDPLTDEKAVPPHVIEKNMAYYKLDQPKIVQFGYYLKNIAQGDLGPSMSKEGREVLEIIEYSFPASLILGVTGMIVALSIGIPAGILSALKRNSWIDFSAMALAMIGISIPSFVIGPLLASGIATRVPFLKVAGWGDPLDWVLPSITLGLATAAYIARITRAGMLETLNQDYIRTARAKGLHEYTVVIKHALRGGIIPAIAYIGPAFAALISGSFIIETIFQVPGLGQHFINGALARDYNLIQGVVILFGILIVVANLAADLTLAAINPRLRDNA